MKDTTQILHALLRAKAASFQDPAKAETTIKAMKSFLGGCAVQNFKANLPLL